MELTTIIGLSAAVLTTAAFLPQTIKTIREKDTRGISALMYSMFTVGTLLWLVYGIATRDWPVLIANAVTFSFSATILALKLKYR
ncbi:SemiSWEET transporter [Paenibacillus oenotherae]|uniref:SemiSWEET transporter n=1 Tax=Paenibacillus oenotherae TaxID=1435645 RepID=A0ABS7D5V8_9BACL|nr:SemiSWEET transporter [Paenibacillus oenotherae]MBW7475308.1 SemiSWEET transporter [Paenibacillus oenotherae]